MEGKVSVSVDHITGLGVDIQMVLKGLRAMKAELLELGCQVSINICGHELKVEEGREAGNGTRTRDILLGKKSVMSEGEPVVTFGPTSENDLNQKQCYLEHGDKWTKLDTFNNDGWISTLYHCPICQQERWENVELAR